MSKPKTGGAKTGIVFMGLGFELVAMCAGGYFLGGYVDQFMGWNNKGSTYLVLLLLLGWFVHLIWLLRQFEKNNVDLDPPQS
jgi:4-amino-4-deoxy-L-arabinose transferase-like glycosyltransferase